MKFDLQSLRLVKKNVLKEPIYTRSGRKLVFEIISCLAVNPKNLEDTGFTKLNSSQQVILVYFAERYKKLMEQKLQADDSEKNRFIELIETKHPDISKFNRAKLFSYFKSLGIERHSNIVDEFCLSDDGKSLFSHNGDNVSNFQKHEKLEWSTERLDALRSLWKTGISISKIGKELGVSRNAVAGKAHRLGLPKRKNQHEYAFNAKVEFYSAALELFTPTTFLELLRHLFRNALVGSGNLPVLTRQDPNMNVLLSVIGCIEQNKEFSNSLLNSYLVGNDEWEKFKADFPRKLIFTLPFEGSSTQIEALNNSKAKYGDKIQKLLGQKKKAKPRKAIMTDNQGRKLSASDFQLEASLWLQGIERSEVTRVYSKLNTDDALVDKVSPASVPTSKSSSSNKDAKPHADYKATLDSSINPRKSESFKAVLTEIERAKLSESKDVKSKTTVVEQRQFQTAFREAILTVYQNRCCISGYSVVQALHAAHIIDYAKAKDNSVSNGLCLRADIHILYDRGLIGVSPDFKVMVAKELADTEYAQYSGIKIALPTAQLDWPDKSKLRAKYLAQAKVEVI